VSETRTCKECADTKPIEDFSFSIKPYRYNTCKECRKTYNRQRNREYCQKRRLSNPEWHEKKKAYLRKRYAEKREEIKASARQNYLANRSKVLSHRKKPEVKARICEWRKQRLSSDLNFRVSVRLRNRIRTAVVRSGSRRSVSIKTEELLGCSIDELIEQFKAQFKPGMTYKKLMAGEIHIDHIRPCASFDLTKLSEQKKCFHHSNLQPLWADDNRRKNAKWEPQKVA
jgi:transposase-like protein